jgi:hypothetical protein
MSEPDCKLCALEWRLYVVAVLAAIYVITWRVLERSGRSGSPRELVSTTTPAVWLDDLPPEQRRNFEPPAGWVIACRCAAPVGAAVVPSIAPVAADSVAPPAPRLVRVPVQRPRRVRTRSS